MDPFAGRPLRTVSQIDLQRLIDDAVCESLYLDYKQALSLDDKDQKKEFLRDITAFANAEGGLLIYGIQEERDAQNKPTGIPEAMPGIPLANRDAQLLKIEHIMKDGIDERLPRYELETVDLGNGNHVLMIRVPASLRAPHMVTSDGERRFHIRANRGKQDMSTAQIRDTVLRGQAIEERVRQFVEDRHKKLRSIVGHKAFWLLHLVPLVRDAHVIDVTKPEIAERLQSMGADFGSRPIYCLEGFMVCRRENGEHLSHALTFRDGTIEVFDRHAFRSNEQKRYFYGPSFQQSLSQALSSGLQLYSEGLVSFPAAASVILNHVSGYSFPPNFMTTMPTVTEECVSADPIIIHDSTADPMELLRPTLHLIWNAFGQPRWEP